MASVMIFSNFLKDGQKSALVPGNGRRNRYDSIGPGIFQANSYGKEKHISIVDFVKRVLSCLKVFVLSRRHDVIIVDSAITGLILSIFLVWRPKQKFVISSFNVPRRRTAFWKKTCRVLFSRVDCFIVHSRNDIALASKLYMFPPERFVFCPFYRSRPARGKVAIKYLFDDNRPFVMSYGGNARDYDTFFKAIEGTSISAIIVAREYNLKGLKTPKNVRVFCNIPLEDCDRLVANCLFTIFTFDGTEPSCGQISLVTSFMLAKPTICTDLLGIRDYVTDGENGLLVKMKDPADLKAKISKLVSDKQLYGKLSEGAVQWANKNTRPEAIHQRIDALVTKLAAE